MTKLLISVRNAAEAQIACDEGVDLIDIKEPARGALGAADIETIEAVVAQVAGRAPLSAALGELLDASSLPASLAGRLRYAKFGLAGCGPRPDWTSRWQQAIDRLPQPITPVAVAYADSQAASAPEPWSVLSQARAVGCGALLLDTFCKTQGSLVDYLALGELRRWIAATRRAGLVCVVAGGLRTSAIDGVLALAPDYIAVRGAVCTGDRTSRLQRRRVRRLAALVRQTDRRSLASGLA
jgi:uncharacterized protein (UPF0264 family)